MSGCERHPDFAWIEKPFGLDQYVWNVIGLVSAHLFTIYYFYLLLNAVVPIGTALLGVIFCYTTGFGVTVGCHRLWCHRSFKAKLPLQIILMILQSMTFQWCIFSWCLDHRIHHKYTDTNADPHNSTRGFLFSHIGWLLMPRHPDCKFRRETLQMQDLQNDPLVRFQSRWYFTLSVIWFLLVPMAIYYFVWELPLLHCHACNCARWVFTLHVTFCVNSFAHKYGSRPYNKNSTATNNVLVAAFVGGEGWHNYHHEFPWDYKASEYPRFFNTSAMFIDFFAWIGWAYDLKAVSEENLNHKKLE